MDIEREVQDGMKIADVLANHPQMNFVRRIVHPETSPKLRLDNGQDATHRMAWGEANGKYFVFPTVVETAPGKLQDLGDKAFDYAIKNREMIEFPTPEEADWFSKNYKMFWK
jgi:hypothetical protein